MTSTPYNENSGGGIRVVSIAAERRSRDASAQLAQARAFDEYVRASERAKQSLSLADGIAAGHAWAEFLSLFVRGAA